MTVSPKRFHDRFTQALTGFLKRAMVHALEQLEPCADHGGKLLGQSREVSCIDTSVVRWHDMLAQPCPACRVPTTEATCRSVARALAGALP